MTDNLIIPSWTLTVLRRVRKKERKHVLNMVTKAVRYGWADTCRPLLTRIGLRFWMVESDPATHTRMAIGRSYLLYVDFLADDEEVD